MAAQLEISDIFRTIWCQKYLAFVKTVNVDINHIRFYIYFRRDITLNSAVMIYFYFSGNRVRTNLVELDSQSIRSVSYHKTI